MFDEIVINSKYYYHNLLSIFMLGLWVCIGFKGYSLKNQEIKHKISAYIIIGCLMQESIDFINRIFLESLQSWRT